MAVFWDVAPYILASTDRRFRNALSINRAFAQQVAAIQGWFQSETTDPPEQISKESGLSLDELGAIF
jgi:hypothetical protein